MQRLLWLVTVLLSLARVRPSASGATMALAFGDQEVFMHWLRPFLAVVILVLTAPLTSAHHSTVAEYDPTKPVKVTGTVTRVDWKNPHIWFFVDVKGPDGTVTNWGFSGAPPGLLLRRGIQRDTLKVGDTIVVEGFRARDGSPNASGGSVTFPDGRRVFTAAAEDPTPRTNR